MFALCCYAENAAGEVRATGINERRSGSGNVLHRRGSNRQRKCAAQARKQPAAQMCSIGAGATGGAKGRIGAEATGGAKGAHRRGSNRRRKGAHRRGSNRRRKGGRAQKGIKKQERPGGAFLCDFPAGKFPAAVIFRLRLFSGGSFGFPDDVIGHFGKITHNGKCQRQGC